MALPQKQKLNEDNLNRPAHKTEGVNRTQTMRFYPFVSTGKEKGGETGSTARIGGGGLYALDNDIGNEEKLLGKANMLFKQSLD